MERDLGKDFVREKVADEEEEEEYSIIQSTRQI